jgi:hypothetical protein
LDFYGSFLALFIHFGEKAGFGAKKSVIFSIVILEIECYNEVKFKERCDENE